MAIEYKERKQIEEQHLLSLYEDAGWYAYTQDIQQLQQAVTNSLAVISAWEGEQLIGLIRGVGDGLTILYIQDILVLNSHKNQGIGTALLDRLTEKYAHVRQKVLLTEDAPDVRHFYEKNNFASCDQGTLVSFAKLNG